MGTRSLTHIHEMKSLDDKETIVCSFFRHFDGYLSGHGTDLAVWLKNKKLVNGIGKDFIKTRDFNRAGTMAVKLMNFIQDESGCEVVSTGGANIGEEFVYDIFFREDQFFIKVNFYGKEAEVSASDFDHEKIDALCEDD